MWHRSDEVRATCRKSWTAFDRRNVSEHNSEVNDILSRTFLEWFSSLRSTCPESFFVCHTEESESRVIEMTMTSTMILRSHETINCSVIFCPRIHDRKVDDELSVNRHQKGHAEDIALLYPSSDNGVFVLDCDKSVTNFSSCNATHRRVQSSMVTEKAKWLITSE